MKKHLFLLYLLLYSLVGFGQDVFFNEVNYNIPGGSGETQFFEIAGPVGTDLTGWEVKVYDETPVETASYSLSGTIPDNIGGGSCNGIVVVDGAVLNTTAGSGMALINQMAGVEQYLTFEQPTTVPGGSGLPIAGLTSQFIPLMDLGLTDNSLQLVGTGLVYTNFSWLQQTSTKEAINTGQTFLPCPPLPVELVNFEGKVIEHKIELQWHTANEINHSHFEVKHAIIGGILRTIGEVETMTQWSGSLKQYNFTFENPEVGGNYFQLDQIDLDGTVNQSNIIYISFDGLEEKILVYPNPVREEIQIVLDQETIGQKVWVQIIDGQGKLVMDQQMDSTLLHSMNIAHVENGIYFLRVFSGQSQWQTTFVKER